MSRVLVTGGAGTIGGAVVRRLLADPAWEVRVADQREAPDWIRQSCEVVTADLRDATAAAHAAAGCSRVIHLAAIVGGIGNFHKLPYTLLEMNTGLYNGVFRGALEAGVERLVYVSSSMVFERATEFPTTEEHITHTPIPDSACTRSSAYPSRSAGRSTPTAPARCPRTSPASPTWCLT
jgi:UDP-glucose 4-epimerase